jgi:hypothetical protein
MIKCVQDFLYTVLLLAVQRQRGNNGQHEKAEEASARMKTLEPGTLHRTRYKIREKREVFPKKTLFGCYRIHLNPYGLKWIKVELKLNSTPNHVG